MATRNTNIGQYRGSNMGAYRNPKMIVEDPLIGLKSFQQSYNSMFAQIQMQKEEERKQQEEFEKAMSPYADKIFDSQENLKYYGEDNRNKLINSAQEAVNLGVSGKLNEREMAALSRDFVNHQNVYNKFSDMAMVNQMDLSELDKSQKETQDFIKLVNAFKSRNATISQSLIRGKGGRYEVTGGVTLQDGTTYSVTDIARITGAIEQSKTINANNNQTVTSSIQAIEQVAQKKIDQLAKEGKYGQRDKVINQTINELGVFLDTTESDQELSWAYANLVKDSDKITISTNEVGSALNNLSGADALGQYGIKMIQNNPMLLTLGDEELMAVATKISAKDNIDDNDKSVFDALIGAKNEIKKEKVRSYYKSKLGKVTDSIAPTPEAIINDTTLTESDKQRGMINSALGFYTEKIDAVFNKHDAPTFLVGPAEDDGGKIKELEKDLNSVFVNNFWYGKRINKAVIGTVHPVTKERFDQNQIFLVYDDATTRADGQVIKSQDAVVYDWRDETNKAMLLTGILSSYNSNELYSFVTSLKLGAKNTNLRKTNVPRIN